MINKTIYYMIIQAIEKSFLLNQNQKEYFIQNLHLKSEKYKNWLLEILQNEKDFMISLLKEYKNKNVEIWMIKQELISKNMRKIQELEDAEKESFDLEKALENIF